MTEVSTRPTITTTTKNLTRDEDGLAGGVDVGGFGGRQEVKRTAHDSTVARQTVDRVAAQPALQTVGWMEVDCGAHPGRRGQRR